MEEILELQRRLAEVQEQKASSAFSDRVIVELVNKIIHDYEMPLLYSSDGQEYMTPEHLDDQIQDLINQRGRIYLIDIPQILSVSLDVIEGRMPKLLKKNKLSLIKLENEIITATFLNQICEEINEDLQQRSQINLAELTLKYNFTMNFLKEQLVSRIESNIIEGNIVGGERLCTLTYQELTRSRFRGILRGATKPLGLSGLAKDFQVDQQVLQNIIEQLISAEEIEGRIVGGTFTPNRFQKNQENIILNFLKQNNYIEYTLLTKQLFIAKPEETLKQMFKDNVIMLDDCAFLKDNLEELKEQILNLLIEEGHTDLSFMFPTILTEADIETIVNKHLALNQVELDETFIFSHQFLDKCVNSLKEEIIKQLLENPQKSIQEDKDAASDDEEDDSRKKKGGKGGKKQAQPSASASARVEKKEKKPSQQQKNAAKKQSVERGNSLFSQEEFIEALLKSGVLKKEDRDEIFQTKLYNTALPRLQKFIEQLRREMLDKKKSVQADAIVQYSQLLEDSILIAQVTQNSIQLIEQSHSDINVTLFSTNLQYALRLIIENSIVLICKKLAISLPQGLFIKKDEEDANKNILMVSFQLKKVFKNKDMLAQAISLLPKEYSQFLTKAFELYLRKKPEALLEFLLSNTHLLGVRGILDKKIEKNLLLTSKYYFKDLIKKDKADLKLSFQRVVLYLLIDKYSLCFVGNLDQSLFGVLTVVLTQFSRETEDIYTPFTQALSNYQLVSNEVKEGVEDLDLAQIKFEQSLQTLIKVSKM